IPPAPLPYPGIKRRLRRSSPRSATRTTDSAPWSTKLFKARCSKRNSVLCFVFGVSLAKADAERGMQNTKHSNTKNIPSPRLRAIMTLPRRKFMRAAGVTVSLPLLDCLLPRAKAGQKVTTPRRMVCINTPLGVHPPHFFPEKAGRDYELPPYLEVVKD